MAPRWKGRATWKNRRPFEIPGKVGTSRLFKSRYHCSPPCPSFTWKEPCLVSFWFQRLCFCRSYWWRLRKPVEKMSSVPDCRLVTRAPIRPKADAFPSGPWTRLPVTSGARPRPLCMRERSGRTGPNDLCIFLRWITRHVWLGFRVCHCWILGVLRNRGRGWWSVEKIFGESGLWWGVANRENCPFTSTSNSLDYNMQIATPLYMYIGLCWMSVVWMSCDSIWPEKRCTTTVSQLEIRWTVLQ